MTTRRTTQKAAPFKRTPVPNLTGKGPFDEITRAQLVALLAKGLPPKIGDDDATMRNRASSTVYYHTRKTVKLRPAASGRFRLGTAADWLSNEFPGRRFGNLPRYSSVISGALTLPAPTASGRGFAHPTTIATAVEQICALRAENVMLASALAAAQDRERELAIKAKKWDAWNKKKERKP